MKKKTGIKISLLIAFILISVFIPGMVFPSVESPLYLYYDFLSAYNDFKQCITLYSKETEFTAFFSGNILFYKEYTENDLYRTLLIVSDPKNKREYQLTNVYIDDNRLSSIQSGETVLEIPQQTFDFYCLRDGKYFNPLKEFKFKTFSKPYITNIYYVNEYGESVYFRSHYKNNVFTISVQTYSRNYIPGQSILNSIKEIEVYLDNKLIYNLDFQDNVEFSYLLQKNLFKKPNLIYIPHFTVNNGNHTIKIVAHDSSGNIAIKEKSFYINNK